MSKRLLLLLVAVLFLATNTSAQQKKGTKEGRASFVMSFVLNRSSGGRS